MKRLITIILASISLSTWADPGPEAEKFLKVSNAIWSYDKDKIKELKKTDLESGILDLLDKYQWNVDDSSPTAFIGFKLDLNKDKIMEYSLINPARSGSGGPYFFIVSKVKNRWSVIGNFQGWFYLLPAGKVWNPIIFYSKAGQTYYRKTLLKYSNGKYKGIEVDVFDNGKITKRKSN